MIRLSLLFVLLAFALTLGAGAVDSVKTAMAERHAAMVIP